MFSAIQLSPRLHACGCMAVTCLSMSGCMVCACTDMVYSSIWPFVQTKLVSYSHWQSDKVIVLPCRSRQQTELGKIVNLMSADVNHVMQFFYPFFNQLFSAPALLIASLILLYFQIRYVCHWPTTSASVHQSYHALNCSLVFSIATALSIANVFHDAAARIKSGWTGISCPLQGVILALLL